MSPSNDCRCPERQHVTQLVVLTGGPGAGKTAVLEMARTLFCPHVPVLPEAASILFSGGFPRRQDDVSKRAAQRAIFHVQQELEAIELEKQTAAIVLCDRGSIDGLAYWPGTHDSYWEQIGTQLPEALARYLAVIHLRTPPADLGYNHQNPQRIETAEEARAIDEKILSVWSQHPRRYIVENDGNFLNKAKLVLQTIHALLPECCRVKDGLAKVKSL